MNIEQVDLFEGEVLLLSKGANAVVRINEYGLSRFAFDRLMPLVGMKGKEGIGGKLHVTNYRLIFKSHVFNRLVGKFSIFLPTILEVKDTSVFISKKIKVATQTQEYEFVIWGIPEVISLIDSERKRLAQTSPEILRQIVSQEPAKAAGGLHVMKAFEVTNLSILALCDLRKLMSSAEGDVEQSNLLNLIELLFPSGEKE